MFDRPMGKYTSLTVSLILSLSWAGMSSAEPVKQVGKQVNQQAFLTKPGKEHHNKGVAAARDIDHYTAAIEQLEIEYGAYGSKLVSALLDHARYNQNQGDFPIATAAATRALHIHRVNEGLYNIDQVPIVENLIGMYAKQQHWHNAHEAHDYLLRLYKKNFGSSDHRLLPVMGRLVDSHLKLYDWRKRTGQRDGQHLLRSLALNSQALYIAETTRKVNTAELSEMLRKQALINYMVADYVQNEIVLKTADRKIAQRYIGDDVDKLSRKGQEEIERIN